MRFAIVADDLTGAMDSGVQLAGAGYRTAVALEGAPLPPAPELDAVVADTGSRTLSPDEAASRVKRAVGALWGAGILYKKIDSTLRGPIGAEVEAALAASGRAAALICPAFPAAGRTTRGGMQLVRGEPVERTGFARDPRTPVRTSSLTSLIPGVGAVLAAEELADHSRIRGALRRHRLVAADAETEAHLAALVRAVPDPSEVLWVGSAGLARALAEVYPGPRAPGGPLPAAERVVAAVGSRNEMSLRQRELLAAEPGVVEVVVRGDGGGSVQAAIRALAAGARCALLRPEDAAGDPEAVLRVLGGAAAGLARSFPGTGLILTGGDTAAAVARGLGAGGILVLRELEPGVPIGVLLGPHPCPVVTKAGGFGRDGTLRDAMGLLLGERSPA
ncbi:D-threonate kinase [Rubrobacter xylanophilus DSM 9941]|uniref:four-carbon acid sugar kinase family protein n=1 Tax=Rubrobacter xylanophilus TaxID=49319 RepID=UPI001C6408C7|nr:four-carbon acid sugar kinase family protein [Rubrobacter xylanophilus]QYJ16028.1 D-threonate kinase [Rubrobacter xylanophilus DSM 9941]